MPATVAPAPFVTAQAHIVRVIDGSFYGIDTKDRRAISKWCMTKEGTHPCLVVFEDESVGMVSRLHQDSKTKECDATVAMLDADGSTRDIDFSNCDGVLGCIAFLLGGSIGTVPGPTYVGKPVKIDEDGVAIVQVRTGDDGEVVEAQLAKFLKESVELEELFKVEEEGPMINLTDYPKVKSLLITTRMIHTDHEAYSADRAMRLLHALGDGDATTATGEACEIQLAKLEAALCTSGGKGKLAEYTHAIDSAFIEAPLRSDSVGAKVAFVAAHLGISLTPHVNLTEPTTEEAPAGARYRIPKRKKPTAETDREGSDADDDDEDSDEDDSDSEIEAPAEPTRGYAWPLSLARPSL